MHVLILGLFKNWTGNKYLFAQLDSPRFRTLQPLSTRYFSEKVAPAVHDTAAKREAFAEWREALMFDICAKEVKKHASAEESRWRRPRSGHFFIGFFS
jgi:hypothetical protein